MNLLHEFRSFSTFRQTEQKKTKQNEQIFNELLQELIQINKTRNCKNRLKKA